METIPQMKMETESVLVKTEIDLEEKEDKEAEVQRRIDQRKRSGKFTPRLDHFGCFGLLNANLIPPCSVMENADVFTCKMCKSNYVSKARLEEHIQDKHTTKGGWMHCQLCEYKFRKATKLTEHIIACHDQGVVTKNLTVVEEFNCSLCSFSTNTSFNLVQHQSKVHTEKAEKDGHFNCGHCPFRAATLNAIKSHRYLTHFQKNLEEVGFDITQLVSCIVCSAQFSGKDRLRSHLLERHNMDPTIAGTGRTGGTRYFSCAYCDANYQYLSKLENHEKASHSELPSQIHAYCCPICSFKPMTMYALEVHKKQAHDDLASPVKKPADNMKSEVPRTQIKFSNSLLKFRSTEGTPSGVIQPISSIKGILKEDGNRLLSAEKEQDQPPLKKLKVDELSQRFSKPGSVQAVKPIPGLVSKPATPSSNGTTANHPGPILACSLCSFRYQDLFLKIVCQSKYPRWQMF